MSFTLNKTNNQGFTIVELLIVVVVIAILAAITIVSYNGITNRANASSAKSTATTVQKKIELYNADTGRYPITRAELAEANKTYTLDTASLGGASNPTVDGTTLKGTGYVRVQACASSSTLSATTVTGARITWYDYEKPAASALTTADVATCGTLINLPN